MLKLNKKTVRIISIVVLAVMMLMMVGTQVLAAVDLPEVTPTSPGAKADSLAKTILNTLMWIGVMVAVGMMIFLGIKYVTASPDGKADLKKQLGVYILGFVLILGATTIVGILANAIQGA